MIPLPMYLILGALLFVIGVFGALTRRNAVSILMCLELMLNAVNINMVAFSRFVTPNLLTGQVFAIFIIGIAAAEAALGLAIVFAIFRSRDTINVDEINLMKW